MRNKHIKSQAHSLRTAAKKKRRLTRSKFIRNRVQREFEARLKSQYARTRIRRLIAWITVAALVATNAVSKVIKNQ